METPGGDTTSVGVGDAGSCCVKRMWCAARGMTSREPNAWLGRNDAESTRSQFGEPLLGPYREGTELVLSDIMCECEHPDMMVPPLTARLLIVGGI
jgi:hypothetical protein